MAKTKKDKFMPTVLACEKKLVPSDGLFYGTTWDDRYGNEVPLKLIEKSVRGTVSNRLPASSVKDPLKSSAKIDKANLQRVDSCSLSSSQDTLKLQFTLKVLENIAHPSSCDSEEYAEVFETKVNDYIDRTKFVELSRRYVTNIANGRFLWRNRVGAKCIEVVVTTDTDEKFVFDSSNFSLNVGEDCQDSELNKLASLVAEAFCGERKYLLLTVEAYALIGQSQDVYPSEELVLDKSKSKSKKSKILYAVNDVAAMHSQKIGNALRSIDTWYEGFEEHSQAIAVEPYGSVTTMSAVFRNPAEKKDFYTLFDSYMQGGALSADEEHYVMAMLVRGGVFGQAKDE